MKPLKTTTPLARWLLRICLAAFLFFTYFSLFKSFNLKSIDFYFAAVYFVFGALIIVGGFLKNHSLTVISGLIIFLLSVYQFIKSFSGELNAGIMVYLLPASIAFYFLSTGNDS
ncbi:MAG: hypothetical protein JXB00_20020 [Bacteroidales bacterium]|nr:hypothetical protein [Bacteroidales bacterium]